MSLRIRTWEIVEAPKRGDTTSRIYDIVLLGLIFLNVIAVIVGTVQSIELRWGAVLEVLEVVSVIVFTFDYLARLWSCTVDYRYTGRIRGRFRLALQPMSIIDLISILPFYLPFVGIDLRFLRVLRLLRIFRIAKIGRYYSSLNVIQHVIKGKKEELLLSLVIMGILMVVSSSALYYCENSAQPEVFSSIPATMWWSVETLSTVGYGDMFPMTIPGKLCASVTSMLGIGMFALPTGILGAGFVEEIRKKNGNRGCPHCGKDIH
ncbi:MAG: ion transporter [Armatimonadetes bacterium]|nr:ion transporter [Akkermansiaceae bacterium]